MSPLNVLFARRGRLRASGALLTLAAHVTTRLDASTGFVEGLTVERWWALCVVSSSLDPKLGIPGITGSVTSARDLGGVALLHVGLAADRAGHRHLGFPEVVVGLLQQPMRCPAQSRLRLALSAVQCWDRRGLHWSSAPQRGACWTVETRRTDALRRS